MFLIRFKGEFYLTINDYPSIFTITGVVSALPFCPNDGDIRPKENNPQPVTHNQHPVSSIQYPASSIQHPVSSIQHQVSSIQHPVSSIQHQVSRMSPYGDKPQLHNSYAILNGGYPILSLRSLQFVRKKDRFFSKIGFPPSVSSRKYIVRAINYILLAAFFLFWHIHNPLTIISVKNPKNV